LQGVITCQEATVTFIKAIFPFELYP